MVLEVRVLVQRSEGMCPRAHMEQVGTLEPVPYMSALNPSVPYTPGPVLSRPACEPLYVWLVEMTRGCTAHWDPQSITAACSEIPTSFICLGKSCCLEKQAGV